MTHEESLVFREVYNAIYAALGPRTKNRYKGAQAKKSRSQDIQIKRAQEQARKEAERAVARLRETKQR